VILIVIHFWRHVLESAAESISLLFVHKPFRVSLDVALTRPAEVTYLYCVVLINEQILWFEISVDKAARVQEVDAGDNLDEEKEGFSFGEAYFLGNALEQG